MDLMVQGIYPIIQTQGLLSHPLNFSDCRINNPHSVQYPIVITIKRGYHNYMAKQSYCLSHDDKSDAPHYECLSIVYFNHSSALVI